jgi:hypothetical protein
MIAGASGLSSSDSTVLRRDRFRSTESSYHRHAALGIVSLNATTLLRRATVEQGTTVADRVTRIAGDVGAAVPVRARTFPRGRLLRY